MPTDTAQTQTQTTQERRTAVTLAAQLATAKEVEYDYYDDYGYYDDDRFWWWYRYRPILPMICDDDYFGDAV